MDKNTILGFVLIILILVGFSVLNRPSKEQVAAQRAQDSIAAVQKTAQEQAAIAAKNAAQVASDSLIAKNDTASINAAFGPLAPAGTGKEQLFSVENKVVKITFSNKGGRVYSVKLKNYQTHDSLPLILFDKDESNFGFTFATNNNRVLSTQNLYFEPIGISQNQTVTDSPKSYTFRLKATNGSYLDFVYTLAPDDYMVKLEVKGKGMESVLAPNTDRLELNWNAKIRQQEKGRKFEARYTGLFYKYIAENVNNLKQSGHDEQNLPNQLQWVAFKDQFFSSVLVADKAFTSSTLESSFDDNINSKYISECKAKMSVGFDPKSTAATSFRFYFVPNKFNLLAKYDKGVDNDKKMRLNKLVPLGWGIFGWINQYAIIPMFNFFGSFIASFGLIILLMTLVIKLVLFPMTYKSYMSSAKMRVLKPQIDEINAKIPSEKAMERQKATMDLYRKVGVSPMSGCLPMLLQLPILIAMFNFFPASIELRHQSFLWAKDLSSYDAVITWNATIPFITTYFGNHISLFCLLMTIVSFIYTKINMQSQMATNQQMPGMNIIMYFTPIMMWFWFNDYASGLSYYYFLSTLITIAQTYAIRSFVDENKLLMQLEANKKKPSKKKKGGFMDRLEQMQREQIQRQKAASAKKK
jgi:membrane protein insertase, YidC/Oxa1 family, N-terminal domain